MQLLSLFFLQFTFFVSLGVFESSVGASGMYEATCLHFFLTVLTSTGPGSALFTLRSLALGTSLSTGCTVGILGNPDKYARTL